MITYIKLNFIQLTLVFLLFSASSWAQAGSKISIDSLAAFNRNLSPLEMREDLQVFIDIRKSANSGLYIYRTKQQIDSIYQWAFEEVKKPMSITDFFKIILQLTDFEGSVHNYTEPGAKLMGFLKRQKAFFPYHLAY